MAGIDHLVKGNSTNRIGEARVDKMEADRFNSIVERITGGAVNPSKLAASVTGAPVETFSPGARARAPERPAQGPGPRLGSTLPWGGDSGGNASVEQLSKQVAMLEQRLAQYEVFNGNDNDVVVTSTRKPKGPSNRGPESNVFARDIDPKKAKIKDPVDGKPDGQPNNKDALMAGERVNILGISMSEWREMAGLSTQPVDLTARKQIQESYEDEVEGDEEPRPDQVDVVEHQIWSDFLRLYDTTPEQFAHFVESADNAQDTDALIGVQELEDEFIEAMEFYLEGDAASKETIDQFVKRGGVVQRLKAGKARGAAPLSKYLRAKGGPAQKQGHELPASVKKEDEDLGELWSTWLEGRGLSVEMFDSLVEAAENDDDLATLEALQDMFEAEIAGKRVAGSSPVPGGESEIKQPGAAPQKLQSLAHGQVKPSRKGNFSLPAAMRKKMGLPAEEDREVDEDDAFECDADDKGGPDMKHPGWAKAMSKFKLKKKDK